MVLVASLTYLDFFNRYIVLSYYKALANSEKELISTAPIMMTNTDTLTPMSASIDGGFFGGLLIGYGLKKVIKMLAIVVGLFLAGLAFLQYQQIASINWNKIEQTIAAFASTTTGTINDNNNSIAALVTMSNFGIPLTSSMSIGFTIGFMKG
jgi:uncharacterized membrane protein (Fun14 family)